MARWIYSLLMYLALPVVFLFFWLRGRRDPAYRRGLSQRLGHIDADATPGCLLVHAASVGEVIAATPVIQRLRQRYPDSSLVVTTMTPTGAERVQAAFANKVQHYYLPLDVPHAVHRFLSRLNPSVLVIMETEVWPNLVHACNQRGVPVVLANARMSARSERGYIRFRFLSRPLFEGLDWVAAQAKPDAARFERLGVAAERLAVTGSIKYDVSIDDATRKQAAELREQMGARPVWIAASTHEGEDEQVLEAHARLLERQPDALLILVPRHRERFDPVFSEIGRRGLSVSRRSRAESPEQVSVYLADTMGELLMLFGAADLAFIGGSLIERGGHNPLEAAAWGLPILTGQHVFNFITVFEFLEAEGGVIRVDGGAELGQAVVTVLEDADTRQRMGEGASAVVDANRGAVERLVDGVARLRDQRC
jgi:3-deoxy-D-manno-octulosonic-acid transferase